MGVVAVLATIACALSAVAIAVAMRALVSADRLARVWKCDHDEAHQIDDFLMGRLAESRALDDRIVELMDVLKRRVDALERDVGTPRSRDFTLPEDLDLHPRDSGVN